MNKTVKYVIGRLLFLIPIMLLSSFIVFYLMSLTGDPAQAKLGEDATEEQLEMLADLECEYAQGYYFSKPVSELDFEQYFLENKV